MMNVPPVPADHNVMAGNIVDIIIRELKIRQYTFFITRENAFPIDEINIGFGRFSGKYLHMRHIHAMRRQGIKHILTIPVCSYRTDIGCGIARANDIDSYIHRISAAIPRVHIPVNINAIIAYACKSHYQRLIYKEGHGLPEETMRARAIQSLVFVKQLFYSLLLSNGMAYFPLTSRAFAWTSAMTSSGVFAPPTMA